MAIPRRACSLSDAAFRRHLEVNYEIVTMRSDNNCLYNALAYHLYGTQDQEEAVRNRVIQHIMRNWEEYLNVDLPDVNLPPNRAEMEKKERLQWIREQIVTPGLWGDQPQINAASEAYRVNIVVHVPTRGKTEVRTPEDMHFEDTIHISFHQDSRHYNYLRLRIAAVQQDPVSVTASCNEVQCQHIKDESGGKACKQEEPKSGCQIIQKLIDKKNSKNSSTKKLTNRKPYKCLLCDKTYKKKDHLNHHLETHEVDKKFQCMKCPKSFRGSHGLRRHLKYHQRTAADRKFKCPTCAKAFFNKGNLQSHILVHNEMKSFKCNLCNKAFKIREYLKAHLETHADDKKFVCTICTKSFLTSSSFRNHLRIHARKEDDKKFKCSRCTKSFFIRSDLRKHFVVHVEKKNFLCNVCKKDFKRQNQLNRHMVYHHTTLKPIIQCTFCTKTFRYQHALEYHIKQRVCKTPQLRFPCRQCGTLYSSRKGLQTHMYLHDPTRKFQCEVCKLRFQTSHALKLHRNIHKTESNKEAEATSKQQSKNRTGVAKRIASLREKVANIVDNMLTYCRLPESKIQELRCSQPTQEKALIRGSFVCCYCLRQKSKTCVSTLGVLWRHLKACHLEDHKELLSLNLIKEGEPMPDGEFQLLYKEVYAKEIIRKKLMTEAGYSSEKLTAMKKTQKKRNLQTLEGPFPCEKCNNKSYNNYKDFVRHVSKIHEKKPRKQRQDKAQHTHLSQEDKIGSFLLNDMYSSLELLKMCKENKCQPDNFQPNLKCLYCQHNSEKVFNSIPSLKTHLYLQHDDMYVEDEITTRSRITSSDEVRDIVSRLLQHNADFKKEIQEMKEKRKTHGKVGESLQCPHCMVLHRLKMESYISYDGICSHLVDHHSYLVTPNDIDITKYPKELKVEPARVTYEEINSVEGRIRYLKEYNAVVEYLLGKHRIADKSSDDDFSFKCLLCHSGLFQNLEDLQNHLQRNHLPSRYSFRNRTKMKLIPESRPEKQNPVQLTMENHIKAYDRKQNSECKDLINRLRETTPWRLKKLEDNRYIYILVLVNGPQRYSAAEVKHMLINGSKEADLVIYIGKCSDGPISKYHFSSDDYSGSTVQNYIGMGYQVYYVAGWQIKPSETHTSKVLLEEWEAKLQWMFWFSAMFSSSHYRLDQKIEYEVLKKHNGNKKLIDKLSNIVLLRNGTMFCSGDHNCGNGCTEFPFGHLKLFEKFTLLTDDQGNFHPLENVVSKKTRTLSWCTRNAKNAKDLADLKINTRKKAEIAKLRNIVNRVIMAKPSNTKFSLYFVIIVDDDPFLLNHDLPSYLRKCQNERKKVLYYVGKHSGKVLGMSEYHFSSYGISTLAKYSRMGKRLFLVKLMQQTSADTLRAAELLHIFHGFIRKTVPDQEKQGLPFRLCNKMMELHDFIQMCQDKEIQEAFKVALCEQELFCIAENCAQDHILNPLFNPGLHFMDEVEEITGRFKVQEFEVQE